MQTEEIEDADIIPDELTGEGQQMSAELEDVTDVMSASPIHEASGKFNVIA